jgi:putative Mg2+ transporter-C (MgtC) family protein
MPWEQISQLEIMLRLGLAMVLGGLIGLERERLDRAAGFRTHALVAVASALVMVVSTYGFPAAALETGGGLDPSRMAAQVVSGVGFLGAGVIILRGNTVRGLTTAATIWAVAGLGLAAGGGLYVPAIGATAFMLLIQAGLRPLEGRLFTHRAHRHRILIQIKDGSDVLANIQQLMQRAHIRISSVQFEHDDEKELDLIELTLVSDAPDDAIQAADLLRNAPGVRQVRFRTGAASLRKVA